MAQERYTNLKVHGEPRETPWEGKVADNWAFVTAECGQTKADTTAELIPLHTLLCSEEALPRHCVCQKLPSPASASLNMINFIKPIKGKTSVFATLLMDLFIYAQLSEAFQILNRLIAGMRHLYQIPSSRISEYSAGRKFASRIRIIGGNNTFTYNTKKLRHYGQNESYWTQWHTKGFHNIKLVSLYSESVSRENSKCLHFASVQMKHMP